MSLREIHLLFIAASVILTLIFAYWGYAQYAQNHVFNYLVTALGSFMVASGLITYGIGFYNKTKEK